jgi:putative membrane protein
MALLEEYPRIGASFVWLSVPFSVLVMWVFHTMERIGRVSENPFEGTANDVPITTISRGIEIDLREMLDENPESIPGPIEAQYDTQM